MSFKNPEAFLLILLLPLLVPQLRSVALTALPFSSTPALRTSAKSRRQSWLFLPGLLRGLTLISIITACARPQLASTFEEKESQGIAIQMLIDISSSMDFSLRYENEQVTRMDVAKKVLENFVAGDGEELKGRPNDLIGIISFARFADTVCPLTTGHDALVQIARDITINDRPNEDGTAYGDATALAAARLKTLEEQYKGFEKGDEIKSKIIVLLTDGENNCGRHLPLNAAAMAKEWGIRIYAISLGEETTGKALSSTDVALSQMAKMTGGVYRKAYDFDSLLAIYEEIDKLEKSDMRLQKYQDFKEAFMPFIWMALAFLLLEQSLKATVLRTVP